jgi:hypothetical protein
MRKRSAIELSAVYCRSAEGRAAIQASGLKRCEPRSSSKDEKYQVPFFSPCLLWIEVLAKFSPFTSGMIAEPEK